MSLIGDIVPSYALFFRSPRMIGTIVPDVVIQEDHRDELVITDHPVETGATISDHAFKRPVEVEMHCAWSDSTGGYEGYSIAVYEMLRALQQQREPFSVSTGKRQYSNMLINGLSVTTDGASEKILSCTVALREVIIVSTSGGSGTGGQQTMSEPQQTAPEVSTGQKTLLQQDSSISQLPTGNV